MTRDELIEALERGEGGFPSKSAIEDAVQDFFPKTPHPIYSDYSTSLDAALALMAEVLPGWEWRRTPNFSIMLCSPDDQVPGLYTARPAFVGQAPTPAAALLIAILRATEKETGDDDA